MVRDVLYPNMCDCCLKIKLFGESVRCPIYSEFELLVNRSLTVHRIHGRRIKNYVGMSLVCFMKKEGKGGRGDDQLLEFS